jgi:hypothetical protein
MTNTAFTQFESANLVEILFHDEWSVYRVKEVHSDRLVAWDRTGYGVVAVFSPEHVRSIAA